MSESESAIDAYFDEIERLAQICMDQSLVPHKVVEQPPQNLREAIRRCLELRTQFLSESDERRLGAYFELGLFAERSPRERIAAFAVAFELQHAVDVLAIERQCEDYDSSQELFAGAPSLLCFGSKHCPHRCEVHQTFRMPIGPRTARRFTGARQPRGKGGRFVLFVRHSYPAAIPAL